MNAFEYTGKSIELAEKYGGSNALNCIAELDCTAILQAEEVDKRIIAGETKLLGIPIMIKDNIDVKGLHTTAGSLALSDNLAVTDAPVVRNLRKNGAIILGKTNMTEFANYTTSGMPGGYSSRGGQVIHAADPSLSPSGSSSGSAVAVAAGIVPAAVGTDTSFSIVACAQQNGICGLKPPVGELSSSGIIPIAGTLDSAGAMANNFSDALMLYSAMRDEPLESIQKTERTKLRLAVNTANSSMVSAEQNAFLNNTLKMLKKYGARIEEINQGPTQHQRTIMQWEFKPHLEEYLKESKAQRKTLSEIVEYYEAHPDTMMKYGITLLKAALDETPGGLTGAPYIQAMEERQKIREIVRKDLKEFDAVIMTGPTNIMHFCGLPSVTISGDMKNEFGVRRGLIMYGADEFRLYAAALAVEKVINSLNQNGEKTLL